MAGGSLKELKEMANNNISRYRRALIRGYQKSLAHHLNQANYYQERIEFLEKQEEIENGGNQLEGREEGQLQKGSG